MALYHKYRPSDFKSIVGQPHITVTLRNLLKRSSIPHSFLFYGPRGTGKTTTARVFAKALNCESDDPPCNKCRSCKIFNKGSLDLIELNAASETGVENIRESIIRKVHFLPNEAKYKIYILDEAHMLSKNANNALLKVVEEPPNHVIFILVTTEEWKIIPTIRSRCQMHQFRLISVTDIVNLLRYICQSEGFEFESPALDLIARRTGGCARDAVSMLDQVSVYPKITSARLMDLLGLGNDEYARDLGEAIWERRTGGILDLVNVALAGGVAPSNFVDTLVKFFHSALLVATGALTDRADVKYFDLALNQSQILGTIQALTKAKQDFRYLPEDVAIGVHLMEMIENQKPILREVVKEVQIVKEVQETKTVPQDPLENPMIQHLVSLGGKIIYSS